MSSDVLLRCDDLLLGYGSAILPPVNMEIRAGELWAVVGLNGAGKSTWMRTALGLQSALGGRVTRNSGVRVAYVPQAATLDAIFPVRARDMVEMGTLSAGRLFGFASAAEKQRCREALATVGLPDLERKPLRDLSGGQRQRVLIARAIVSGAQLFFFDEPTSALDINAERAILDLIDGLRKKPGVAVAVITHEMQVVGTRADRALLLDRERGIALADTAQNVVRSQSFVHLFGRFAPRPETA